MRHTTHFLTIQLVFIIFFRSESEDDWAKDQEKFVEPQTLRKTLKFQARKEECWNYEPLNTTCDKLSLPHWLCVSYELMTFTVAS